ncbi:MAG: alpha-L-fucosidase [Acutalibacteraceae bacterium]|nr:alpha-L-fucosidase [Oscillospiraceae bacterium]
MFDPHFEDNYITGNNGFALCDKEVERYISVVPSENQLSYSKKPFNVFIHFGMNTATGREWGSAQETLDDFTIKDIDAHQWISVIKKSGATGVVLTCKHHDGFCLWDTKQTDFSVMNTPLGRDIVRLVSDECRLNGLDFGVYLSPWDMHEKSYATDGYNDFFCAQLTELLTNYGDIFEVWLDGAKGADATAFNYDWERYYELIRRLQPKANIAVCGPDIRWVGNEAGKSRKNEFSVVPLSLTEAKKTEENSQHDLSGKSVKKFSEQTADLGSRQVLQSADKLCWYPAEVDVSIRKGWFWNEKDNGSVKSSGKLFRIYIGSVGNNCGLLLNVPPAADGKIPKKEAKALIGLGKKIRRIKEKPVLVQSFGQLKDGVGYLEFKFNSVKKLRYCFIREDISKSQRIEKFDLYITTPKGRHRRVCKGSVIGSGKIIPMRRRAIGAVLVIRQSRSVPCIEEIGFYE